MSPNTSKSFKKLVKTPNKFAKTSKNLTKMFNQNFHVGMFRDFVLLDNEGSFVLEQRGTQWHIVQKECDSSVSLGNLNQTLLNSLHFSY